jgi:hypothetical protein
VIEHVLCTCEVLGSITGTEMKNKKEEKILKKNPMGNL